MLMTSVVIPESVRHVLSWCRRTGPVLLPLGMVWLGSWLFLHTPGLPDAVVAQHDRATCELMFGHALTHIVASGLFFYAVLVGMVTFVTTVSWRHALGIVFPLLLLWLGCLWLGRSLLLAG